MRGRVLEHHMELQTHSIHDELPTGINVEEVKCIRGVGNSKARILCFCFPVFTFLSIFPPISQNLLPYIHNNNKTEHGD